MNFSHLPWWFQPLGWTLAHFIWEGALIGGLAALAHRSLRRAPAEARYNLACVALLLLLLAPAATFWHLADGPGAQFASPDPAPLALTAGGRVVASDSAGPFETLVLPACVGLWLCGVLLLSLRALGAWGITVRDRRYGLAAVPAHWDEALARIARRLRVTRPVRLYQSTRARGPMIAGWLRPVILTPAAAVAGLTPQQFEAVLAHEMAHILRNDYLVNLAATAVETLLFYHPAVWWVSRQIRIEREHCCDDLAVTDCGDRLVYARALVELEQLRACDAQLAMAASGGSLTARIRRLLERDSAAGARGSVWLAAVAFTAAATALLVWGAGFSATALAQHPASKDSAAYSNWVNEDVGYIVSKQERLAFQRLTTDEERQHFIEQFWLRRDPTPGTAENEFKEEHYRRIAYANEHFASSLPGWKTNRGRTYIVYGPPDEIESHPAQSHGIDQWRYRTIKGVGDNVEFDFDGGKLLHERAGPSIKKR
ncbi:MAG: GWxTD domain-containing protein [Bryobacteraceae bacterium]